MIDGIKFWLIVGGWYVALCVALVIYEMVTHRKQGGGQ